MPVCEFWQRSPNMIIVWPEWLIRAAAAGGAPWVRDIEVHQLTDDGVTVCSFAEYAA